MNVLHDKYTHLTSNDQSRLPLNTPGQVLVCHVPQHVAPVPAIPRGKRAAC